MTKGDAIRDEQRPIKEHLQRVRHGAELLHSVAQEKPTRNQTKKRPAMEGSHPLPGAVYD